MLKGRVGRLYWGRCMVRSHKGRRFYAWNETYDAGVCVFGWFVEWHR